jgi:hypothetical protein
MMKTLMELGIERMHLSVIKATCDKPMANVRLNGEN